MTFVENHSMCSIELWGICNFNTSENSVEQEAEVVESSISSIQVMPSSNGVKIRDSRSDLTKEFLCLSFTNLWDLGSRLSYLNNTSIIFI